MAGTTMMRAMNAIHGGTIRLTRGRLGWHLYGMPVVELTTVGRRSGERRTSLLTSPVQLGDAFVIVASRGGEPVHPGWYHNLVARPEVMVRTGRGPAAPMRARVAEGEERDELWRRILEVKPHYGGYQEKTSRVIPLVVLEPID